MVAQGCPPELMPRYRLRALDSAGGGETGAPGTEDSAGGGGTGAPGTEDSGRVWQCRPGWPWSHRRPARSVFIGGGRRPASVVLPGHDAAPVDWRRRPTVTVSIHRCQPRVKYSQSAPSVIFSQS